MSNLRQKLKEVFEKHNHPYDGVMDPGAFLAELETLIDEEKTQSFQEGVHAGQESVG